MRAWQNSIRVFITTVTIVSFAMPPQLFAKQNSTSFFQAPVSKSTIRRSLIGHTRKDGPFEMLHYKDGTQVVSGKTFRQVMIDNNRDGRADELFIYTKNRVLHAHGSSALPRPLFLDVEEQRGKLLYKYEFIRNQRTNKYQYLGTRVSGMKRMYQHAQTVDDFEDTEGPLPDIISPKIPKADDTIPRPVGLGAPGGATTSGGVATSGGPIAPGRNQPRAGDTALQRPFFIGCLPGEDHFKENEKLFRDIIDKLRKDNGDNLKFDQVQQHENLRLKFDNTCEKEPFNDQNTKDAMRLGVMKVMTSLWPDKEPPPPKSTGLWDRVSGAVTGIFSSESPLKPEGKFLQCLQDYKLNGYLQRILTNLTHNTNQEYNGVKLVCSPEPGAPSRSDGKGPAPLGSPREPKSHFFGSFDRTRGEIHFHQNCNHLKKLKPGSDPADLYAATFFHELIHSAGIADEEKTGAIEECCSIPKGDKRDGSAACKKLSGWITQQEITQRLEATAAILFKDYRKVLDQMSRDFGSEGSHKLRDDYYRDLSIAMDKNWDKCRKEKVDKNIEFSDCTPATQAANQDVFKKYFLGDGSPTNPNGDCYKMGRQVPGDKQCSAGSYERVFRTCAYLGRTMARLNAEKLTTDIKAEEEREGKKHIDSFFKQKAMLLDIQKQWRELERQAALQEDRMSRGSDGRRIFAKCEDGKRDATPAESSCEPCSVLADAFGINPSADTSQVRVQPLPGTFQLGESPFTTRPSADPQPDEVGGPRKMPDSIGDSRLKAPPPGAVPVPQEPSRDATYGQRPSVIPRPVVKGDGHKPVIEAVPVPQESPSPSPFPDANRMRPAAVPPDTQPKPDPKNQREFDDKRPLNPIGGVERPRPPFSQPRPPESEREIRERIEANNDIARKAEEAVDKVARQIIPRADARVPTPEEAQRRADAFRPQGPIEFEDPLPDLKMPPLPAQRIASPRAPAPGEPILAQNDIAPASYPTSSGGSSGGFSGGRSGSSSGSSRASSAGRMLPNLGSSGISIDNSPAALPSLPSGGSNYAGPSGERAPYTIPASGGSGSSARVAASSGGGGGNGGSSTGSSGSSSGGRFPSGSSGFSASGPGSSASGAPPRVGGLNSPVKQEKVSSMAEVMTYLLGPYELIKPSLTTPKVISSLLRLKIKVVDDEGREHGSKIPTVTLRYDKSKEKLIRAD